MSVEEADLRGRRGLARDRRTRSSSGCAPPSSRPARRASARSPASTRSTSARLLAASTDGVGTKLMLARERGRAARLRRRPRRALHQRRAHDRRRAAVPARLRRREPDRPRAGRRARRGRRRGLPRGRLSRSSAARRPSCPAIYREGELDFAGTCVGVVDRDALIDGSRCRGGRRRDRASRPRACTRTASRSSGACSRTRTTTATTCSRRRGCTSTRCARCGRATRRRSRT